MKYCTYISLTDLFFVVCRTKKCKNYTVCTERRLDDIRKISLIFRIIKICKILAGYCLMTSKIIICTICDAPKFTPSKGESELNISRSLAIECKLCFLMITKSYLFFLYTKADQPVMAELSPIFEPFKICSWFTEKFKFHLLKCTCTESEVAGCDLVTE